MLLVSLGHQSEVLTEKTEIEEILALKAPLVLPVLLVARDLLALLAPLDTTEMMET